MTMRGHNICFLWEIRKNISELSSIPPLIYAECLSTSSQKKETKRTSVADKFKPLLYLTGYLHSEHHHKHDTSLSTTATFLVEADSETYRNLETI